MYRVGRVETSGQVPDALARASPGRVRYSHAWDQRRAPASSSHGGADDVVRPGDQERDGGRRVRSAPLSRRRRRAPRAHRHHRPHPGAGARSHRCRRPGGGAGLRGRPYPHGRAGVLGPARHLLVLPRHHHGRDGQLRLHAGAVRRGGQAPRHPQPAAGRGHPPGSDGGGDRLALDHLPGVPRLPRGAAQGHQLRRLHRPLGAADVRDGRAGVRAAGRRDRSAGDGAGVARRHPCGRRRLHHVALAEPRDPGRPSRGEPGRELGRAAQAGGRAGRAQRRDRGAGRGGRGPRPGRPGSARLPRPPARACRRKRTADHLRRVQPARRAGRLARVPRPSGRDSGRGRPHVRAGAQPLAQRPAVVPNPAAIRPAAGVEGAARSSRSPSSASACATPSCAGGWSKPPRGATGTGRSARRRAPPTTTGCSSSTRWPGRIAPWRRLRASVASIRPKP